ncbi:MAG: TSCPD domain-containing protein [Christensenellaceae bacterium]
MIYYVTYSTKGTCSRQILFDVDAENKLHNVRFIGGCGGNLQGSQGSSKARYRRYPGASLRHQMQKRHFCPDQLSKAIAEYKTEEKTPRPKNSPTAFLF